MQRGYGDGYLSLTGLSQVEKSGVPEAIPWRAFPKCLPRRGVGLRPRCPQIFLDYSYAHQIPQLLSVIISILRLVPIPESRPDWQPSIFTSYSSLALVPLPRSSWPTPLPELSRHAPNNICIVFHLAPRRDGGSWLLANCRAKWTPALR
jgi:hypothetical protein